MDTLKDEQGQNETGSEITTSLSVAGFIFTIIGAALAYYSFSVRLSAIAISVFMFCSGLILSVICYLKAASATMPRLVFIVSGLSLVIFTFVMLNVCLIALALVLLYPFKDA
jgi:hypothetical protein